MSSISNKLLFGFIVILLVSFLFAGVVGIFLVNNMVSTNLQQDVVHDLDAAEVIYQNQLTHVEDAVVYTSGFSRIRDPLINNDSAMLREEIVNIYDEWFRYELDILTVTDKNGIVVARARNPAVYGDSKINNTLIKYALNGFTVSSTEVIPHEELLKESEYLAYQAYMDFTPTPKAKPRPETNSSSGMVLITAAPIYDNDGNVIGVLYGADLLNRDYKIVDRIKNALYKDETYIGRDVGTATIFQEDFRISTNVPSDTGERAITTRVSQEVNEAVLERGEYWKDRAFVVNEWYVTAYKPILNFDDEIIGILYVGILEKPYIDAQYEIVRIYLIFLILGFIISIVMARYYGNALTKPINKLIKGTEAISKGKFKKIDVGTQDEIGKLADAFNDMSVELQKTMGELISSKNEITTIFESISDVASAQDQNMKIIFANEQAKKIYGEFIIGRFCYNIYEGRSEKCEDCPAYSSLQTGEVMKKLHSKIDERGNINYYEITGSPFRDEHNNIIGNLVIRRDVTEQMELQDQIIDSYKTLENAYKELQKMDQIKSELVANVSHEIRTPLTSIKGYAELMQDDSLGPITDMQRKSLAIMLRNIDRLTRLITNVVDLAKFDYEEFDISNISINDVIDYCISDLEKIAENKRVKITAELEDDLILEGNEDRLIQVFINLLENAIKFSKTEGEVVIKAYREDNNLLHTEIRDSGIGIPEDELEKIFGRFYQVDSSPTRSYGGTGLGLAISKKIIEFHNGKIWAESKFGNGSVFHVILPTEQPKSNL